MTAKPLISNLSEDARESIRNAVLLAVRYWPNSHLGEDTPRQDIRRAFRMLRSHAAHHQNIFAGIGVVERDAYAHVNM